MSGFRFCRTDDMPLLVDAYNRTVAAHGAEAIDVTQLKRWIRELDLWCSSCAVALDDAAQPIGVLLGAKRPTETLVMTVGVHPDHVRHGHGRHLLTSLSSKLAILGPPALVAEVPEDDVRAAGFLSTCGFTPAQRMSDFARPAGPGASAPAVVAVSIDDLLANDALVPAAPRPWARAHEALLRRRDALQARAVVSPDRLEAFAVWREDAGTAVLEAVGAPGGPEVLAHVLATLSGPIRVDRLREDEVPWEWLERAGFRRTRAWRRWTATARPA